MIRKTTVIVLLTLFLTPLFAQIPQCRVVRSQFLYDTASFPSCHAATIEELPNGDLVAAFFGGSYEGCSDVCIWMCRKNVGKTTWSVPQVVAKGDVDKGEQHPCWNPVLFQTPGKKGELLLFYKTGIYIKDWVGHLLRSKDGGKTWKVIYCPPYECGAYSDMVELPDGSVALLYEAGHETMREVLAFDIIPRKMIK